MAYIDQARKQHMAPAIKQICKKYGVKARLSINNHSTLVLNVSSGSIDFIENYNRVSGNRNRIGGASFNPATDHISVNVYWYKERFDGQALAFIDEVLEVMNKGNHDRSDLMTDYHDVGWYVDINIGKWDRPYVLTAV